MLTIFRIPRIPPEDSTMYRLKHAQGTTIPLGG